MEGAQAKVAFSAFPELHKHADVFNDVCCRADFLNLVVGDSHVKNLAKSGVRNKEAVKKREPRVLVDRRSFVVHFPSGSSRPANSGGWNRYNIIPEKRQLDGFSSD